MDEPLSNLDAKLRIETRAEIRRIHRELGRATIYVTHDQDEALSLADRIVVMKDGVVAADRRAARGLRAAGEPARRALHGLSQRARARRRARGRRPRRRWRARTSASPACASSRSPAGARAVAIRPEEIASSTRPAARTRSPARVDNVEYCGRDSLLDVRDRRRARCCTCASARQPRVGDSVRVHVPVERALVYPAGLSRWPPWPPRPLARASRSTGRCCWSLPAAAFMLLLFVYPFLYGLWLSFKPKEGGALANYAHFFTTDNLWPTIWTTLKLALPATLINVGFALPIAFKMRVKSRYQRWVTTILVVPITLGTVLIAEGMLTYFGPKGWLVAVPAVLPSLRRPDPAHAQLLGRADLARDLGLSVRVPADPVVHHRHRSRCWRARRRRWAPIRKRAVPPHLPAAAGAGSRDVLLPGVRAGVLGVPVRRAAGLAGRADARDLDRRVRGGVRAVRLFAGVGDRDDHGLRAAHHRRRGAGPAQRCSTAARSSGGKG